MARGALLLIAAAASSAHAAVAPPPAALPAPPPPTATGEPAPMKPEAKARYDRGLQLFGARDYASAVRELEAGYALDPRREFLFAEAQAYRLAGDCLRAIPLYRRFLDADPPALQVQATRLGLERCTLPSKGAPRPGGGAGGGSPPPPEVRRWLRDPLALGAVTAGVVATGIGIGFFIASDRALADADAAQGARYADFARFWELAERRRTIAIVSLVGGVALLGVGGARFVLVRRRDARAGLHVMLVPAPDGGAALALGGSL